MIKKMRLIKKKNNQKNQKQKITKIKIPIQIPQTNCPKCQTILTYIEGTSQTCSNPTCSFRFQQITCPFGPHCETKLIFQNYHQSQKLQCTNSNCEKKFQQISCPFCYQSVFFDGWKYNEGKSIIHCCCGGMFQQMMCGNCHVNIVYKKCDYHEGKKVKCPSGKCGKVFNQVNCCFCGYSNIWKNGDYQEGKWITCNNEKCLKRFCQINCPNCVKSIVWKRGKKNNDKILVCPFKECGKPYQHLNCKFCGETIVFKNADHKIGNYVSCQNFNCGKRFIPDNNNNNLNERDNNNNQQINDLNTSFEMIVEYDIKDLKENIDILKRIIEEFTNSKAFSDTKFLELKEQYKIIENISKNIERKGKNLTEEEKKTEIEKEIEKNNRIAEILYKNMLNKIKITQKVGKLLKDNENLEIELKVQRKKYRKQKYEFESKVEDDEFLNQDQMKSEKSSLENVKLLLDETKRQLESNNTIIENHISSVLGYLKFRIKNKDKRRSGFEEFLISKGVFIERKLSNYCDFKFINSDPEIYKAKLKSDMLGDEKILKVLEYNEINEMKTKNEIINLQKLDHPSIVKINCVFVFNYKNDRKKIVMEMTAYDKSLFNWLKKQNQKRNVKIETILALPNNQKKESIKNCFRKVLEAISYIHEKNIEHRNINPSNIMVFDKNIIKIVNFGLSRSNNSQVVTLLKQQGDFQRYLPPEKESSKAGDIFSFGKMLFEAVVNPEHINFDLQTIISLKYLKFEEIDLLKKLIEPNPLKRISGKEALEHEFFNTKQLNFTNEIKVETINTIQNFTNRVFLECVRTPNRIHVTIHRRNVIDDFLHFIFLPSSNLVNLLSPLRVKFQGETGVDEGGLSRELFSLFTTQLIRSQFVDPVDRYFLPTDKKCFKNYYFLIGKVFCRCLFYGVNLKLNFGPLFYSLVLDKIPKSFDDWSFFCKIYDQQFLQSQLNILKLNDFGFVEYDQDSFSFNEEGETKILTKLNKRKYVSYKIKEKLIGIKFREENIKYFKKGFFSCMSKEHRTILNLMNGFELEQLLYGSTTITKQVLLNNISFSFHYTINNFIKKWINESNEIERIKFLRFVTGLNTIPFDGKILKDRKEHKIRIKIKNGKIIYAHTCFYDLDIGKDIYSYREFKNLFDMYINEMEYCGQYE